MTRMSKHEQSGAIGMILVHDSNWSGPPEKSQKYRVYTGPDPMRNHKATRPVFNVWPS